MVNRGNVSAYEGKPPPEDATEGERKLSGGPIYDPEKALALLDSGLLEVWSEECARALRDLQMDLEDACALLQLALTNGRFLGAEWCLAPKGGPWAACDAYVVSRREWIEYARKEMTVRYYLKFAISRTGRMLLLVRCHVS